MAVVDSPMVDVLPDKPRTRGIARTKAGKARTATRSVAARCAVMPSHQEPKINWTQPESRSVLSKVQDGFRDLSKLVRLSITDPLTAKLS